MELIQNLENCGIYTPINFYTIEDIKWDDYESVESASSEQILAKLSKCIYDVDNGMDLDEIEEIKEVLIYALNNMYEYQDEAISLLCTLDDKIVERMRSN